MTPAEVSSADDRVELTLYVNGASDLSRRAIANARRFCDENLHASYGLTVVDVNEHVDVLRDEQILAVPTLVKSWPLPIRKVVGDLSRPERVLDALGLVGVERPTPEPV
jgi:circadian clock protein KaiB